MHWQEPAGGVVDVHDAVCGDSVLVPQPAQLDEQPVVVGVLLLSAVELFHARGGLLVLFRTILIDYLSLSEVRIRNKY